MNYKNTILILGRSELVGNISSSLLYFNELYPIIAINNINPNINPTYTIFVDKSQHVVNNIIRNHINTIILTPLYNSGIIPNDISVKYFTYKPITMNCKEPYNKNTLYYSGFTHDVAISYAIQQGYKNIILVGTADFTNVHYDNNTKFNYSEDYKNCSINFIEDVCSKWANIYTMNKNSLLNVQRITPNELIESYKIW